MTDTKHPPCPSPFNLAAYVLQAGSQLGDKPALEVLGQGAQTWSYGEVIGAVRGVASGLARRQYRRT